MKDLGLLVLRGTAGGLLAGHGAQKLFGWFGGYGLEGTAGWLESLGLRPAREWALLAGVGEFGGGLLTALGLFHPVGPLMLLGPMAMATGKVHWGKSIWATEGGA
jgi:putative oxidoreductase